MLRRPVRRASSRWAAVFLAASAAVTPVVLQPTRALAEAPASTGPVVVPTDLGTVAGAQVLDLGDEYVGVWSWSTSASELAVYRLLPGPRFALESVEPSPLPVPTTYEPIAADESLVAYETGGQTVIYDTLDPSTPLWSENGTDFRDFWWPYLLTGSGVPDRVVDVRTDTAWSGPEFPSVLMQDGFVSHSGTAITFDVDAPQPFASPLRGAVDAPSCTQGGWSTTPVPAAQGVAYTCADQDDWRWHFSGVPASADVRVRTTSYRGHLVNTRTPLGALSWVVPTSAGDSSQCSLVVMDQQTGATRDAAFFPCTSPTYGGNSAARTSPAMTAVSGGRVQLVLAEEGVGAHVSVEYAANGGVTGPLGQPRGLRRQTGGGGWTQDYRGGRIHWSPVTGAHAVLPPFSAAYDPLRGESGPLGYPVGSPRRTAMGGWTQDFQAGRIHWHHSTGAHAVYAPIRAAYDPLWGESGDLGYPVAGRRATAAGGWTQDFEFGRIHWHQSTGAHAVYQPISGAYDPLAGESGPLGYPVAGRRSTMLFGWTQDFQYGRVHWDSATGAHAVYAPISPAYDALGGESGVLRYPLAGRRQTAGGGWTQDFQMGRVHWSPSTGAHAVFGAIGTTYDGLRGESGRLGYPVSGRIFIGPLSNFEQRFQHGRITERRGQTSVTFY